VTEAEWLACTDPVPMLTFLMSKASNRKLRLFGCACCRQVWELLTDETFRTAVETAERFSDGLANKKDLAGAKQMSGESLSRCGVTGPTYCAFGAAWSTTRTPVGSAAMYPIWVFTSDAERSWQLSFLHDLFGNPFRPVAIDPAILEWHDATIPTLARTIYDDRRFDDLPILADALEEVGCHDADILSHCRGPGPHVRGCWVVDLLLGKE